MQKTDGEGAIGRRSPGGPRTWRPRRRAVHDRPVVPTPADQTPGTPGRPGDGVPTHRRSITFQVFETDDAFRVVGELRDDRPWAHGTRWVEHVHHMELEVTVRRSDLTITRAQARMHRAPHAECPDIEKDFGDLVGMSVARGYTKAVQARFGRTRGCTHLEVLARTLGPVVVQAVASSAARLQDPERTQEAMSAAGSTWFADSCHVWDTKGPGPGMQKVALGWRPGVGVYPTPRVEEYRRSIEPDVPPPA